MFLIDENGTSLGVKPVNEAISIAQQKGLDLVEVSPNANPPVCKILDYGKFRYEVEKKTQKSKSKNKAGEIKEIRFGLKTDEHDFQTKVEWAKKLVEKGYKIRVTVTMKGRENIYSDRAIAQLKRVKDDLQMEYETEPMRFGTRFSALLIKKSK